MSMIGLAASPGTAVDPMWCHTSIGTISVRRAASALKRAGHAGS